MLIAVVSSLASALIAAFVSMFTTRYTLKHGQNYAEQIHEIHETIAALATTQEDLRKQQAEQALRVEERHAAERKRLEAANWKPEAGIFAVNEGVEHVNKLTIMSLDQFRVVDVSLLSETGAKVCEILKPEVSEQPCTARNIKIPHSGLNQLASRSPTYFQLNRFEGAIRFTVERVAGESVRHTGEVKFTAETIMLGNAQWFHLVG